VTHPHHHSPVPRTPTRADKIAEAHLTTAAALDPVGATLDGITGHEDRLTDYSPDGHRARARAATTTLQALNGLTCEDEDDKITIAALTERLGLEVERHEAGLPLRDLNNIACPVQLVREAFDLTETDTAAGWESIAARLPHLEQTLVGYRTSLQRALDDGWRPAARQVQILAGQCREFAGADGFYAGTATRAAGTGLLTEQLLSHLRAGGTAAANAHGQLADWLTDEVLPLSGQDDAIGRELYPLYARSFLGAEIDLQATYDWAYEELNRIEQQMADVARRIDPAAVGENAVKTAVATLDSDPARNLTSPVAFRDWMQQVSDAAVTGLAGTHFDIPEPLRDLRCRIAPTTSGVVYYTPPSEDFARPGQMWWSVPDGTTTFSTWRETSTIYHEGVPGHHLQIAGVLHRHAALNRWRRVGCWVSGYGEGWALYAERLMEELGFLQDPGDLMGMLDAQALRACRVIVDIGVHCALPAPEEVGGGTWDAHRAWAFLRAHTSAPDPSLRFELDRYLGWPGQAISYKVGERLWTQLRDELRTAEGPDFDLRSFHARALGLGAVGLDVLRKTLLQDL
jgi:uncharacterized protein (DUF885 family)